MRILWFDGGAGDGAAFVDAFRAIGDEIVVVADAATFDDALRRLRYDLVALDLGAGVADASALARRSRLIGDAPLMILPPTDGFAAEAGRDADEIASRPLAPDDLLIRAAALIGRWRLARLARRNEAEGPYIFAGWRLDPTARDLRRESGGAVDLTAAEFDLLLAFLNRPGEALSREALLERLRGRAWRYFDRSIDTLVARLRRKIETGPGRPKLIRSVRGVGYVFCAQVSRGGFGAAA